MRVLNMSVNGTVKLSTEWMVLCQLLGVILRRNHSPRMALRGQINPISKDLVIIFWIIASLTTLKRTAPETFTTDGSKADEILTTDPPNHREINHPDDASRVKSPWLNTPAVICLATTARKGPATCGDLDNDLVIKVLANKDNIYIYMNVSWRALSKNIPMVEDPVINWNPLNPLTLRGLYDPI